MIRKIRLISNIMTSQPEQQTTAVRILPNISRSKVNQTMKFVQLTGYNMRNNFLEKLYTKSVRDTSHKPFPGNLKLSMALDQ